MPLALLVLVAVTTFTLTAYRSAVERLLAERIAEFERLAEDAAQAVSDDPRTLAEQRRRLPFATGMAILDSRGRTTAVSGEIVPISFSPERLAEAPFTRGPDETLPGLATVVTPLDRGAAGRFVRVDFTLGALSTQQKSLRILVPVVMGSVLAVTVLVMLFLRHIFAPLDSLLQSARAAGAMRSTGEGEDDIAELVKTLDRALTALAKPEVQSQDDLATLERTLAQSLSSGLLLLDAEGLVLALNPVGAAILGVAAPSPGAGIADALSEHPELAKLLGRVVAENRGLERGEVTITTNAGTRTLGLTLHPLRRDDGIVRGHLVFFADLTETRRADEENRLAKSLAQLGELAAGVAHELRNSLATLNGYLALIARRPGEESIADYLAEIRRESGHLERVVEDFLAFARPGSARLETVDIEMVVRRAAADPAMSGSTINVRRNQPNALIVSADPHLLERALRNLLHNAVQANKQAAQSPERLPEAVEVDLTATDSGSIEVSIQDRGPGIPPDVRARLFEPFSAGRPGGVGLGLALAHRIVVLHGGTLALRDRQSRGTCAVLTLPMLPSR